MTNSEIKQNRSSFFNKNDYDEDVNPMIEVEKFGGEDSLNMFDIRYLMLLLAPLVSSAWNRTILEMRILYYYLDKKIFNRQSQVFLQHVEAALIFTLSKEIN